MNETTQFHNTLLTHLLSMHGAIDEQIEDKPLAEVVAFHESLHPAGMAKHATSGDNLAITERHQASALVIGKVTRIYEFDLPMQIKALSPADARRRLDALESDSAVIKQGTRGFDVFYINPECVYIEDIKHAYDEESGR